MHPTVCRWRPSGTAAAAPAPSGTAGAWPGSDTLLAGAAITWGTSRPFIYQLIGDPRFWGDVRLGQLRVGWPLRRAAAVVALWPAAAEALSAMYDIEPEAVHVIPNGRDATHFRPPSPSERAQARAGLGLGPDDRVACWIGALNPSWQSRQPERPPAPAW